MTEKRFYYFGDGEDINSGVIYGDTELTLEETVGIMNELHKENQKLYLDNAELKCTNRTLYNENAKLKQFKEDVFNKIDMHLRMLPTARDNEFNEDDGDPSLYTGAIYMLETLKKELKE